VNPEEKKKMGARIKACRQEINLSQEGLAEKLDMKRTNIANYEAGRVVPPGSVLSDLADIFGVSSDYILGRTETPDQIKTWLRSGNTDLTEDERDKLAEEMEDYFLYRKNRILKERKKGE
jgi:transcriptional regulator with XRE-family HTH domain